jgi:hypothetical protein
MTQSSRNIFFILFFLVIIILFIFLLSKKEEEVKEEKYIKKSDTEKNISDIRCDSSLWEHVYHAKRLIVYEQCKTVSGIIKLVRKEPDGDYHIRLKPDSEYENLLNEKNYEHQKGCLVLEPICANKVTQTNAIEDCRGFINKVYIPGLNEHVKVTGSYVLDTQHGWMEIHPVTKIETLK